MEFEMTELGYLFNKYGCDKSSKHHYDNIYHPQLMHLRDKPIKLLEVGIFRGESLQAWLDYFPNAEIFGIDVFTRVDPKQIAVLQNPRVKWFKMDSTSHGVTEALRAFVGEDIKFDVIVDDGLHTPRANADTFSNLIPLLADDGKYFIEDVWPLHIMRKHEWDHHWLHSHPDNYNKEEMRYFLNTLDPYTYVEFDLRERSGQPDSYIIKVTK